MGRAAWYDAVLGAHQHSLQERRLGVAEEGALPWLYAGRVHLPGDTLPACLGLPVSRPAPARRCPGPDGAAALARLQRGGADRPAAPGEPTPHRLLAYTKPVLQHGLPHGQRARGTGAIVWRVTTTRPA